MSILDEINEQLESANKEKKKVRRNKHERDADRKKISEMYLAGKSQYEIGKDLGLSQSQVSAELAIVRKNWVEETNIEIDVIKAEKLKELEWAKNEFRQAWEKSKRKKAVTTKRGRFNQSQAAGVNGSKTLTTFEVLEEDELGDKKYMDGFLQCISEELKITGGYAPKKVAETDPTGKHEAGQAAREEALRLLDDIASKMKPKELAPAPQNLLEAAEQEKNYIDAEEVEEEDERTEPEEMKEEIKETFKLLGETKGLLCFLCEKVTWKPIDFQNRYCPTCNVHHENSDMEQISEPEEDEARGVDPSKLNLIDYNNTAEAETNIVAVGNAQEGLNYNKRYDQNMSRKMADMSKETNFGKKGKI